jgi:hypothetical protein
MFRPVISALVLQLNKSGECLSITIKIQAYNFVVINNNGTIKYL